MDWFNQEFIRKCKEKGVEPIRNGMGQLLLICPRIPPKEVQEEILAMVPSAVSSGFVPSLSNTTKAMIGLLLAQYGVTGLAFGSNNQGSCALEVEGEERTALMPESPLWGKVIHLIKNDPFTQNYLIKLNGKVIADSQSGDYVPEEADFDESGDPTDAVLNEFQVEAMNAATEKVQARFGNTPQIKDDRFEYEKDFLPPDVGTDLRIILESTNSVEEFLKSI
jgi:hypothetical protein